MENHIDPNFFPISIHNFPYFARNLDNREDDPSIDANPRYPQASTTTATFPYASKICIEEGLERNSFALR
jgi:hypothetical protein